MDSLQQLAVALGLAGLAGINLYLTVFATGLAIQQQWIYLAPQYEALGILAHPVVIALAGTLYVVEFFADKVPWVDSLWDSIHTVIRPVGGTLLAIRVLGNTDPVFDIIVALLCGGVSLTTHTVKAGTRLIANTSPEPFSNIALSVVEDASVLGGLALLHYNPLITLAVLVVFLGIVLYFAPKVFRALKVILWLIWKKLNAPAADTPDAELPDHLPASIDILFSRANVLNEKILWAVPCVSGSSRGIPRNVFGYLIATRETPGRLFFVAKQGLSKVAEELDLQNYKIARESKFFSENLIFYSLQSKARYLFMFDRTQRGIVNKIGDSLREQIQSSASPAPVAA
jgi:hypothetical protein